VLALFPRGNPGDSWRDKITQINFIVARLDDQRHVFYPDIGEVPGGSGEVTAGHVPAGSIAPCRERIWHLGAAVKDKVAELMK
jgi:hypothetical protein